MLSKERQLTTERWNIVWKCVTIFYIQGQVIQRLGAFHALSRSAHVNILLFAHLIIYYMYFAQYKIFFLIFPVKLAFLSSFRNILPTYLLLVGELFVTSKEIWTLETSLSSSVVKVEQGRYTDRIVNWQGIW